MGMCNQTSKLNFSFRHARDLKVYYIGILGIYSQLKLHQEYSRLQIRLNKLLFSSRLSSLYSCLIAISTCERIMVFDFQLLDLHLPLISSAREYIY